MAITRDSGKAGTSKTYSGKGPLKNPAGVFGPRPQSFTNYSSAQLFSKPPQPRGTPAPPPGGGGEPTRGGGGYIGGGSGAGAGTFGPTAAATPAPAAAPPPMTDVDWFNQDSIYRASAGRSLADLTSQLAQILADRDEGYRQLDTSRADLTRGRQEDLTGLGDDFAGRGLLGSGLYAQQDDRVQADYTRQGNALDATGNRLGQQFGARGNTVDLKGLDGGNPAQLSSIWGLLGSMGMNAGNNYNSALSRARAESAQRSTSPLIQTTTW